MIRKQDPRLEYYNRGHTYIYKTIILFISYDFIPTFYSVLYRMLRMVEMGLVTYWQNVHQPKPVQCFDQAKQQSDIRQPEKIGMKHLYVLFVMLLVGYFVSFTITLLDTSFLLPLPCVKYGLSFLIFLLINVHYK